MLSQAGRPALPNFDWSTVRERMLAELYGFLAAAPLLIAALLLTLIAWWLGGWFARRAVVGRLAGSNPFLKNLLTSTIRGGATLLGVAAGLQLMNATAIVGALLGTAGVVGIALGFAFKDIIENYIAGVLLSLRQPFRLHDHVKIAEHEGLVTAMTARATVLMTLDGNNLRVPNAIVFKSVILNFTQNPSRRFEFDLTAAPGTVLDRAAARIERRIAAIEGVLDDPAVEAFAISSSDGKTVLRVRAWVDQRQYDIDRVRGIALRESALLLERAVAEDRLDTRVIEPPAPAEVQAIPTDALRSRRHLLEAGEATAPSGDLLDATAPVE